MPTVKRMVEEDIRDEEVGAFIRSVVNGMTKVHELTLANGEVIEEDRLYNITPTLVEAMQVMPNTPVLVVQVIPDAGVCWCAHLRPEGNVGAGFFRPDQFTSVAKDEITRFRKIK